MFCVHANDGIRTERGTKTTLRSQIGRQGRHGTIVGEIPPTMCPPMMLKEGEQEMLSCENDQITGRINDVNSCATLERVLARRWGLYSLRFRTLASLKNLTDYGISSTDSTTYVSPCVQASPKQYKCLPKSTIP